MATMYEKMMERLVDRIERQAVDLAKTQGERDHAEVQLHEAEQMLKEERKLREGADAYNQHLERTLERLQQDLLEARQERDSWREKCLDVLRDQEPFERLAEAVVALDGASKYDEIIACRAMARELVEVKAKAG